MSGIRENLAPLFALALCRIYEKIWRLYLLWRYVGYTRKFGACICFGVISGIRENLAPVFALALCRVYKKIWHLYLLWRYVGYTRKFGAFICFGVISGIRENLAPYRWVMSFAKKDTYLYVVERLVLF
ncbi:hypothetical protein NIES4071_53620 [Calothrix sp. NIES-4071]|nr:hypothetical protein NIES4071_53620 [Calothrix sp. NIES-4071]BAZ59670.1 hypothetical protein NIES4105_53570 [Calothrix sp. NIES-4105]